MRAPVRFASTTTRTVSVVPMVHPHAHDVPRSTA
jgi:hypothetical protein